MAISRSESRAYLYNEHCALMADYRALLTAFHTIQYANTHTPHIAHWANLREYICAVRNHRLAQDFIIPSGPRRFRSPR